MGARRNGTSVGADLERAIGAAAETGGLADLGERALPHLRRAVGAAAVLLYRYDEEGRLIALAGDLRESMGQYSSHYLHLDPVQRLPRRLAPRPRVVLATRHVDRRAYLRSAAYGEFYAAHRLEHLACAWLTHLPYGAPGMTGLLFTRPPGRDDFGEPERRLLSRALPALTAAAARAERLRELDFQRQALEAVLGAEAGPARLVLAPGGRLIWSSKAGERLLGSELGALPEELRHAARRLHDAALGRSPVAPSPTIPLRADQRHLDAHLSLLRTASGAPLVLVELEGGDGDEAEQELARRFQLTRAEGVVLRHLAEGLANAAIAARLHVSVETVRTHVARILGKLGVGSRVEAALLASRHLGRR